MASAQLIAPRPAAIDSLGIDDLVRRREQLRIAIGILDGEIEQENCRLRLAIRERCGHTLSARERQVLALVHQGKSNKEIGNALFITERTVKYHVANLLRICQAQSRHEL